MDFERGSKFEITPNPKPKISPAIKFSFNITYILLLTTATITFIEAIRTKNPVVRHVLNLETCVSVIAGYFYSIFTTQINTYEKTNTNINWKEITETRYVDWSITTPLMLLALCVVLSTEINVVVHLPIILLIVILNYAMLYAGYLGETKVLDIFTVFCHVRSDLLEIRCTKIQSDKSRTILLFFDHLVSLWYRLFIRRRNQEHSNEYTRFICKVSDWIGIVGLLCASR